VGKEETTVHLSVMKEDWENGIAILKEILSHPRFDDHILDVVKKQAVTALSRQGGDAGAVAAREGTIWHFRGHPYGRDPLKGLETIPKLTKKELKEFMERHFVTSKMVVAIAGDIDKKRAVQEIRELLKDMRGRAPDRSLDDPSETPPVLAFIHKAGQVQSQVRMILPSVKRSHPDYWKLGLLMHVFGGSDSLLYRRLRDDLGLVYATYFYQTYQWRAGMLVGYIGCKGDMTGQSIKESVGIMEALQKEVPSEELEQKRLDTLNSFVFNVDTPRALVEVYARYHMRDEPIDTLEKIQDIYIGTQKDELKVLAEDFLQPRRLQIFVVGDRNIKVKTADGGEISLEEDLKRLAKELELPFREIPLR
jgi:zinc protease